MGGCTVVPERVGLHAIVRFRCPAGGLPVLTAATAGGLAKVVRAIAGDGSVRSVTLASDHESVFLAGADLEELNGLDARRTKAWAHRMRKALAELETLPVPVIAALHGDVHGGGCEVALAADVCVAVRSARLAFTQARYGLMPAWGGVTRLTRRVGQARALLLLLTGRPVRAAEARVLRLVDDVVADRQALEDHLAEMRATIEMAGPEACRAMKESVRAAMAPWSAASFAHEDETCAAMLASPERREGLRAAAEHRPPEWAVREG